MQGNDFYFIYSNIRIKAFVNPTRDFVLHPTGQSLEQKPEGKPNEHRASLLATCTWRGRAQKAAAVQQHPRAWGPPIGEATSRHAAGLSRAKYRKMK